MSKKYTLSVALESMEEGTALLSQMIESEKKVLLGLESLGYHKQSTKSLLSGSTYFAQLGLEADEAAPEKPKTSLWQHIKKMAQGIIDWISKKWSQLVDGTRSGWKSLKDAATAFKARAMKKFSSETDKEVSEAVAEVKECDAGIAEALKGTEEVSKGEGADEGKLSGFTAKLKELNERKKKAMQRVSDAMSNFFKRKKESAIEEAPISEATAGELIVLADEGIKDADAKKSIMDRLKAGLSSVVRLATSAKDGAVNAARSIVGYCGAGISAIRTSVASTFERVVSKFKKKDEVLTA